MDKKFIILVVMTLINTTLLFFIIYLLFKFHVILETFCFEMKEMTDQWRKLVEVLSEILLKKK